MAIVHFPLILFVSLADNSWNLLHVCRQYFLILLFVIFSLMAFCRVSPLDWGLSSCMFNVLPWSLGCKLSLLLYKFLFAVGCICFPASICKHYMLVYAVFQFCGTRALLGISCTRLSAMQHRLQVDVILLMVWCISLHLLWNPFFTIFVFFVLSPHSCSYAWFASYPYWLEAWEHSFCYSGVHKSIQLQGTLV